ncbi:MAG: hypothetical protein OEN02_02950 [Gammaproteobacteria bacterium]|nr:hypothetical protein [Gammaproteobacteria bacterium]
MFSAAILRFGVAMAVGESAATQTAGPYAFTLDAQNLTGLLQSMPGPGIIGSRHAEDYRQGHIDTPCKLALRQTRPRGAGETGKIPRTGYVLLL